MKEELSILLQEMQDHCQTLGGHIPPHEVAWFKRKLAQLHDLVNRMFT